MNTPTLTPWRNEEFPGESSEFLWYLASPYDGFEGNLTRANELACKIAGGLIQSGHHVFSPIAHSHQIAVCMTTRELDPTDHSLWMPLDQHFMNAADGLIVAMMPGWETSRGVQEEIVEFTVQGKPIRYYDPSE